MTTLAIEVLRIAACPSWEQALDHLREAIDELKVDAVVTTRLITSSEDTSGTAFAGSPTITLEGSDLFPSFGGTRELACRVYSTEQGLRGAPSAAQIVAALRDRL